MRISDWSSDVCSSDLANAAALVETGLPPPALLKRLKEIEADFGKRAGQRWGARTLDLDIVLWSGGLWSDRSLTIPHPSFRERNFVLAPLTQIAPRWRDPVTSLTIWQLHMRLKKQKPVDRRSAEQTYERQSLMRT